MASRERQYYCPNCGQRIDPARLGGSTNVWDVLMLAVIVAGLMGLAYMFLGHAR